MAFSPTELESLPTSFTALIHIGVIYCSDDLAWALCLRRHNMEITFRPSRNFHSESLLYTNKIQARKSMQWIFPILALIYMETQASRQEIVMVDHP